MRLGVKSASNVIIQGYETMVIPINTDATIASQKGDAIFVEGGFTDQDKQLFVPRCLLKDDGMMQISNVSGQTMNTEEGEVLASGNVIREYSKATPSFYCNKISQDGIENEIDPIEPKRIMVTAKDLGIDDLSEKEQGELVKS